MNDLEKLRNAAQLLVEATSNGDASNSAHNDESEWIIKQEACKIAKVSKWTISRWIDAGYIKGIKLGKAQSSPVRIYKPSLLAYLASLLIRPRKARKEVEE